MAWWMGHSSTSSLLTLIADDRNGQVLLAAPSLWPKVKVYNIQKVHVLKMHSILSLYTIKNIFVLMTKATNLYKVCYGRVGPQNHLCVKRQITPYNGVKQRSLFTPTSIRASVWRIVPPDLSFNGHGHNKLRGERYIWSPIKCDQKHNFDHRGPVGPVAI